MRTHALNFVKNADHTPHVCHTTLSAIESNSSIIIGAPIQLLANQKPTSLYCIYTLMLCVLLELLLLLLGPGRNVDGDGALVVLPMLRVYRNL